MYFRKTADLSAVFLLFDYGIGKETSYSEGNSLRISMAYRTIEEV